ncbi:MAG: PAS domain S-box protein [Nitrospiraceae bacterium]|nr:PAS domain S-box protein [Nitrospiraceae bacterium]
MNLRVKLPFMLSFFILVIAVLAVGTILIFEKMSDNMKSLRSVGQENQLFNDLNRDIGDLMEATRNWGLTGEAKFRRDYNKKAEEIRDDFAALYRIFMGDPDVEDLEKDYRRVFGYTRQIMVNRQPVGAPETALYIRKMETDGIRVIARIDELQEHSVNKVLDAIRQGEATEKNLIRYHVSLIILSGLVSVFLILRIRRAITGPFNTLVAATDRLGSGDFSYRIQMDRTDEFGKVAAGFNGMATELEASHQLLSEKLSEAQLLLEVTRIAGTTIDLKDMFFLMAETIATRMGQDCCMIFARRPELQMFLLEASSRKDDSAYYGALPEGDALVRQLLESLRPVMTDTAGYGEAEMKFRPEFTSVAAVPIIRENACSGILMVGSRTPHTYGKDEINTLVILSHTVGSVARNAELYNATRQQLQKLTVLYELTRAVTSVLDLAEILRRTAEGISGMLSARGCIIRLVEGNRLRIKSSYGLPRGVEDEMELPLGDGIAGWVAKKGVSLLVEDVLRMPDDMRVPKLDVRTVVCVPLKLGDTVIGTLGLYDKIDAAGQPVPFDTDDLNTAEGFAGIASIAIDKSTLYETEVHRERMASEEKKRLDILFDSVQGGIISLAKDYTIISANRYVEDWTGMSGAELIGRNSVDVFHEKIGICPHCAAKPTFETGEINTIMQSRGMNYAELSSYPVKDAAGEVSECVVFIQDITERVLYQEETLSLYREVIQTKEYLEGIIENSADAIVTTDLEGKITSWNRSAEKIFGFTEAEASGTFMPFVPEFLVNRELENIEKIRKGEVVKDLETLRRKKDGTIIEVSLTLSPIKDAAGTVIGISGISRDISEKKLVEKELIRRSQELARLFFISSAMRGTLELDKLLRMVLVAVTMSDGMGFNRAILLLVDESRNVLKGAMGVGPASPEEAWRIWDELAYQRKTMEEIMQDVMAKPLEKNSFLDRLTMGIEIPLDEDTILTRSVREKQYYNVKDVREEPLSDTILIQQLGTQAYAIVPLVSRDKVIGIIWVDNYFNRKEITDEDMKFLASFSNHIASAIENARLFEQVKMTEQQLENIFESMSDMVYFNSNDYVIKSVNKAVTDKIGLPASQIIGRKCYEIFHGTNEPYKKCPHHKTVTTKKAYIEELEDPHLGGTFLTSSSPIFDLNNEFIGSVHVVRDVTEMKNLQQKLIMSQKMAALGEVAAKVAHEIRNPLVSVGGFAKRLEKKLDGNLKEYAGIIVKEVSRLEHILREILGFVKEVRLSKEKVSLNAIIDDIIMVMGSDTEDRGIRIAREYTEGVEVFVDPHRVKEAIMNIVTNAIQSLPGSGEIHIRTYVRDAYAVLEVRDTGKGIGEEDLGSIFNPFFTTKASGTGLGLAITHRIIQEHNGTIEVESEVGKGSVFKVLIPMKEDEQ